MELSPELKLFLDLHLFTIEELDILLQFRANREQQMDAVDIARLLRVDPISVSNYLTKLRIRGLVLPLEKSDRLGKSKYAGFSKAEEILMDKLVLLLQKRRADIEAYLKQSERGKHRILA